MSKKIAIIGGGAAGLAAAVVAADYADITVYEKNERVGKKLLQTGNGRCNLLNTESAVGMYSSNDSESLTEAFDSFRVSKIINFFGDMGLLLRFENDGRVYPLCNQASAVLDVLRYTAAQKGAVLLCGKNCISVKKQGDGFILGFDDGSSEYAHKVILSCGGKAAPKTGSDGTGYELAKKLGHSVTKLYPALVPLKSPSSVPKSLKGIRCRAEVTLLEDKRTVACEDGEIQFTDYGITGIAVMQLSRYIKPGHEYELKIDFVKEFNDAYISHLIKSACDKPREVQDVLLGIVQKRVAQQLIKSACDAGLGAPVSALSGKDIKKITAAVKGFVLPINGTLSWDHAQATKGGIPLGEVNVDTFESKLCRDLYIIGEMLDCDGACGGFNLGWAWNSAIAAAKAAGVSIC